MCAIWKPASLSLRLSFLTYVSDITEDSETAQTAELARAENMIGLLACLGSYAWKGEIISVTVVSRLWGRRSDLDVKHTPAISLGGSVTAVMGSH